MKPAPFSYYRPSTVGDALAAFASSDTAKILAGGQSLIPSMNFRLALPDLLVDADHVVVVTSFHPGTHRLIDRDALAAMKPTATLVNAARGPVVDTDALVEALAGGTIAAAGLDVTDPEPIPADHPLVALPNCFIVPHIGSATVRTRILMA